MKQRLLILTTLMAFLCCEAKTRLELAFEEYENHPKWQEAKERFNGTESLLDSARKAHDHFNKELEGEGRIIYTVDFKPIAEVLLPEGIEQLGLDENDYAWQGIEEGWIHKENAILMAYARASDGHIYLIMRSGDNEPKLEPAGTGQPM
jgi:hypothetical protein